MRRPRAAISPRRKGCESELEPHLARSFYRRVYGHWTVENGKVFDTTKDSVTGSFEFKLGKGDVIKGWDLAVATMKKGEKATVTIKPEYGYGKKSMGKIPANSTLTFEMELVDFRESSAGGCCVVS